MARCFRHPQTNPAANCCNAGTFPARVTRPGKIIRDLVMRQSAGLYTAVVLALIRLGLPSGAWAQALTVSSAQPHLVAATALPGQWIDPVTDNTTTYDIATGAWLGRIQARITGSLPPGVVLEALLEPPAGARSMGPVALTTLDQDVVIDIPPGTNAFGLRITYKLSATVAARVLDPGWADVILTLTSS